MLMSGDIIRGGVMPYWEEYLGINRYPPMKKNKGYTFWHDPKYNLYYPENRPKPFMYIAVPFYGKRKLPDALEGAVLASLKNDFGFEGREIDWKIWQSRGIHIYDALKKSTRAKFRYDAVNCLGRVFLIASPLHHKYGSYINKERHHVIYAPEPMSANFGSLSIFKAAAEYLNIDPDVFRPQ